jgi:glycosyltransferase involved in cell wall biosynthesis
MINYEFPPLGGGTGIACAQLLKCLQTAHGVEIDLITSTAEPELSRDKFSPAILVHRLPVSKQEVHYWRAQEIASWTWQAMRYAGQLSREHRFDLAHCWGGWPAGLIGYRLRHRLPYIVSLRGSDVPGYNARLRVLDPLLFRGVSRQVWRAAARVLAVSRNLRELALQTWPEAPIDIIPNGVDTNLFMPGPIGTKGLLFVGRLIERKGVHRLIEAFAGITADNPEWQLTIVGDGPQRSALEAVAAARLPAGRVVFRGRLDHGELARVYQESSVFVLPAVSDAMPNVVLEAMAAGLAIVTTRTGAGELIDRNGFVIDGAKASSLQDAIANYMRQPNLLSEHRQQSRLLAERMSWHGIAERMLAIYAEIATAVPQQSSSCTPPPTPGGDGTSGGRSRVKQALNPRGRG